MRHSPVNSQEEDLEIINRILAGDHTACNTLVYRHQSYVYTLVWRMLKNKQDTEEVTQDVFMKVIKKLRFYKQEAKFTTWLYRITYNETISFVRKRKQTYGLDEIASEPETDLNSLQDLLKGEQQQYLQEAMRQLQAEDAAVLTLFYLKEQNMEEIAEVTGQSKNNVKVRLHRARKRLLTVMQDMLKSEVPSLL